MSASNGSDSCQETDCFRVADVECNVLLWNQDEAVFSRLVVEANAESSLCNRWVSNHRRTDVAKDSKGGVLHSTACC